MHGYQWVKNHLKKKYFKNYQVNNNLMKFASKEAIFMHCLPAHRDEEVSSELLDSKEISCVASSSK